MIFLNSVSSAAALVFYLPSVCTHTDTEGKQRKARVRKIFKIFRKNTIFNEHPVCYVTNSDLAMFLRVNIYLKSRHILLFWKNGNPFQKQWNKVSVFCFFLDRHFFFSRDNFYEDPFVRKERGKTVQMCVEVHRHIAICKVHVVKFFL